MVVHIRTKLEESDANFEYIQEFAGDTVRLEDHLFEIKWLIKALPFFDTSLDPMNRETLKSLLKIIVVQMYPEDLQVPNVIIFLHKDKGNLRISQYNRRRGCSGRETAKKYHC